MQLFRRRRPLRSGTEAERAEPNRGRDDKDEERQRRLRELGLRVLIVASIFGIAAAIGFGLDRWYHPPIEAVLGGGVQSAGYPLLVTGVAPDPERTPARGPAPIEADLRVLRIDDRPALSPQGTRGSIRELLVRIPVDSASCGDLEARIGGSCDGFAAARPLSGLEAFEVLLAEEGRPAAAWIWAEGAQVLELTHPEPLTQRSIPDTRSLRVDAPRLRVDLVCYERTPFKITTFPSGDSAWCSPREATLTIRMIRDAAYLPTISLGGLARFETHVRGRLARVAVDAGDLSVGGSGEELLGEGHSVEIRAADDDTVAVDLVEADAGGGSDLLLRAPRAEATLLDEDDRTPSWVNRHGYPFGVIAILGSALFAALVDFAIFRRR